MRATRIPGLLLAQLLAAATLAVGQAVDSPDPYADETVEQRDVRMAWWREARFGLFIHWGISAVPGLGDWAMRNGRVPVAEYKAYARDFKPTLYDPDAWVGLAKQAGMKYLIITAKHHDGFALYDSDVTKWDVAGATPYKKDLLRPLVEAAHREGLKIGFYYSQAQDWVHRGGAKAGYLDGEGWDDEQKGSFDEYLRDIAVPQVTELLRDYPIDVLWWDTPILMNRERAGLLLPLLRQRPGIIHNNRLGGGFAGDLDTPEQRIPTAGLPGRDWETCMTLNDSWGFKSDDQNWKSAETIVRNLVDIASKGGNYLLEVGPTAEGEFPAAGVERLAAVGRWMDVNHDAIHATTASPFFRLTWGRCTARVREDGATLYLHVFTWPTDGILRVPGLLNDPREIRVLATGAKLEWRRRDGGVQIGLPLVAPDANCSVLAVEVAGPLRVEMIMPRPGTDGRIVLPAELAELNNPNDGGPLRVERKEGVGRYSIGYWSDPRAWVKWTFKVDQPGAYDVEATFANPFNSSRFNVLVAGQRIAATIGTTGGWGVFKAASVGRVRFAQPGEYTLAVRPDPQAWTAINLCDITLKPVR